MATGAVFLVDLKNVIIFPLPIYFHQNIFISDDSLLFPTQ